MRYSALSNKICPKFTPNIRRADGQWFLEPFFSGEDLPPIREKPPRPQPPQISINENSSILPRDNLATNENTLASNQRVTPSTNENRSLLKREKLLANENTAIATLLLDEDEGTNSFIVVTDRGGKLVTYLWSQNSLDSS